MDINAIYRKTDKGIAELSTKHGTLERRLRPLLILVDGRRPLSRVQALVEGIGIAQGDLVQLEAQGLIEPADAAAAAAVAATPRAEDASKSEYDRFSDGRRFLNETATDVLGVRAFFFVLKVERTASTADLLALLDDFEAALARKRDRAFAAHCRGIAEAILR